MTAGCARGPLALVVLEGSRVGVDLDERDLSTVLVDVGVEGEQAGFVRLDNRQELAEELP